MIHQRLNIHIYGWPKDQRHVCFWNWTTKYKARQLPEINHNIVRLKEAFVPRQRGKTFVLFRWSFGVFEVLGRHYNKRIESRFLLRQIFFLDCLSYNGFQCFSYLYCASIFVSSGRQGTKTDNFFINGVNFCNFF